MASYEIVNYQTFRIDPKDLQHEMMANFSASILEETTTTDGMNSSTTFTIAGFLQNPASPDSSPIPLAKIEVPAENFAGMQWPMANWGARCIILPGSSIKDDLRTAIQLFSSPVRKTIYRHTGWIDTEEGNRVFLHAAGAIGKDGNNPSTSVRLPQELSRYTITSEATAKEGALSSLALIALGPPEVTWPLWAATMAPLFGPVDFAMHLTGRTGTFKSEVMSLFQCHFGAGMDARHLPGSWSSTPNALEAQAYLAKDVPFTVDDFVPTGTSWQQRSYQTTSEKLIRAQGNQAGRARLTDISSLQSTYYPRGIILSTGEDTPEGHSVRARMVILELSPDDISKEKLTKAQKNRNQLPAVTAALIQHLAKKERTAEADQEELNNERNLLLAIGHSRTPSSIARLIVNAKQTLTWMKEEKFISSSTATELIKKSRANIIEAGKSQVQYLLSADPCEMLINAIRQILAAGLGHFRTLNGGIPAEPETLGWTLEDSSGDLPSYKSHGPCIGWIAWGESEFYLEATAGFALAKKVAGNEMTLGKQTIMKRLKESGYLTRCDESRQRNTIRISAQGHTRQVLAMSTSKLNPDEEEAEGTK